MPLPTALQARLKKRGLIKNADLSKAALEQPPQADLGCPNAWNPYHTCVTYCEQHWGKANNNVKHGNQKNNELKPLPPGWFLVPDPERGDRSYYWNVNTNLVSWLHPQDPTAEVTLPASAQNNSSIDSRQSLSQPAVPGEEQRKENINNAGEGHENKKIPPKIKTGKHPSLLKAQREKAMPYKKKQKDDLDPMDPSSYSDVARGNWSSGLKEDSDVKTGVDTTASGPLFQQRPYPSPGDVLRRNKQAKGK